MSPEHVPSFDSAKFRQVLGHFPTGVTVISSMYEDTPVGLAVGSFASLSLEPPQVLFCPGKQSSTWPKIQQSGAFCVNILAEDQEDVCRVFASSAADKFAEVGWRKSGNGSPIIDGVLAYVDCTVADVVEAGDHYVVIGAVHDLEVRHEGGPLLFFRGGYGRYTI
ncbi:flavin reductase family protein [Rhabdothermincola salaria]|uniref:flavin reductase family protein n=1 Tax=Rhabdothermincola salaria TaxID=2903142 RepID=UPI001E41D2AC|nr:flavin reductase family protein [Rhabdothermincola salaria]